MNIVYFLALKAYTLMVRMTNYFATIEHARGLEPQTLRLLAVHSNQPNYDSKQRFHTQELMQTNLLAVLWRESVPRATY